MLQFLELLCISWDSGVPLCDFAVYFKLQCIKGCCVCHAREYKKNSSYYIIRVFIFRNIYTENTTHPRYIHWEIICFLDSRYFNRRKGTAVFNCPFDIMHLLSKSQYRQSDRESLLKATLTIITTNLFTFSSDNDFTAQTQFSWK